MTRTAQDPTSDATPLSPAAAERGLYLDAKGVRGAPPVLLGVAVDDTFEAVVVDARFGDAALARGLRVGHLEDELASLVARAAAEDRTVVLFGPAQLAALQSLLGAPRPPGNAPLPVRTALDLLDAWHAAARHTPDRFRRPARPGLDNLLALVGRRRTRRWDARRTAPRLRHVEQQLLQRGAFDALTATAKAKWTRLVQHGEADARGLRVLTCELARRLAASQSRP